MENRRWATFDPFHRRVFERSVGGIVRRGGWLVSKRVPGSKVYERQLFWPETETYAPANGFHPEDQLGPLIDDRRFVAYRQGEPGLWILDPESGERTTLEAPDLENRAISRVRNPYPAFHGARTPAGAPILQVVLNTDDRRLGKIVGNELICVPDLEDRVELLSCQDEDSILVIAEGRRIERRYFGSPKRDVLFPRPSR
jgi:hypothetical protein